MPFDQSGGSNCPTCGGGGYAGYTIPWITGPHFRGPIHGRIVSMIACPTCNPTAKGGCPHCGGAGMKQYQMQFLCPEHGRADVVIATKPCPGTGE